MRAANPHPERRPEVDLLREIEYGLRILAWQNTRDGSKGVNAPERISLPWDPPKPGTIRDDVLTWDELAERFGWQEAMGRYFPDESR